jgi:DNA-binding response OmpR family regulator
MTSENKKKVLVIDDDNNLNFVLVDKLNLYGFDSVGAKDGEEGLEKALEIHPDVILLDVLMPKMDGWTVLEKLREDKWGKNAKVILLTVLDSADFVAKAMEKNTSGYLVKTNYSLDQVVDRVENVIKGK